MFWGLKLFSGKKYKSIVEKSFHVSRAVVELSTLNDAPDVSLEVHVVLHNIDYIVCILSSSTPQTPLDLEISEGEEMTVYVKLATPTSYAGSVCVHLTGYYYMDQTRDGCYDDDEEEEEDEELFSEEEYNDDCDVLFGNLSSEEDEDFDYPSLQHLSKSSITEIDDEEDEEEVEPVLSSSLSRKRKKSRKFERNAGKLKRKKKSSQDREDNGEDEEMKEGKEEEEEEKEEEEERKEEEEEGEEEEEEGEEDKEKEEPKRKQKNKKKKKKTKTTVDPTEGNDSPTTSGSQDTPTTPAKQEKPVKQDNENASVKQDNFKKTFSCGVEMEELKCGTGKIPKQGSLVRIRYSSGYLSINGGEKVFNDFEKDTTLCFRLGRGEVMPGLEKGMKGMKPGGSRRIIIPPSQRRSGDVPDAIPEDADVSIFVKLLKVK